MKNVGMISMNYFTQEKKLFERSKKTNSSISFQVFPINISFFIDLNLISMRGY